MNANADRAEIEKFDELAARWWDPQGPLRTLHALNPLRIDYIRNRAPLDGARVLDVGCGGGLLTEALARAGASVIGIDPAASSIAVASDHAAREALEVDYRQVSVEEIAAAEPGAFDIVTCLEVLEHVPDPDSLIAACADAVRPGGSVFLSTINRNPKSFLFAIVGAEHVLRLVPRGTHQYLRLLKPAEVAGACRSAGLVVEDLTGLHYNPLTDSYRLGGNVDVNYFLQAVKPVA